MKNQYSSQNLRRLLPLCLGLAAISFAIHSARAATIVWDGGGTTAGDNSGTTLGTAANWGTAANPAANALPVNGDTIEFSGFDTTTANLSMNSGLLSTGAAAISVTAGQANALTFVNAVSSGYVRLAASGSFSVASGAGAVTFQGGGTAATASRILFGSGAATTQSFNLINESANAVTWMSTASGDIMGGSGTRNLVFSGSGDFVFNQTITAAANQTLTLTKNGSGALTLAGANTFAPLASGSPGSVTLNAGTLNLNHATALGAAANTFVIAGGTINNTSGSAITLSNNNPQTWNGDFAFSTADGTGVNSLNLGTGAVSLGTAAGTSRNITTNGSGTLTIGGVISNGTTASGLIKSGTGTLVLGGANTFTGATLINAGTLALASTGSLTSSQINVASGATFNVSAVSGYSVGPGVTLTNNGTLNGGFSVAAGGTLNGSGTFSNAVTLNGALNPGNSPGVQTFAAGLTLGTASTTTMEIAGLGGVAGTDHDFINVTGGTLNFDGTLAIVDFGGFDISAQTAAYNLFDSVTGAGDFDVVTVDGNALAYSVGTDDWSATVGDTTYNFAEGTGVLSVTVVPEPTAALLGGLGLLGLLRRRRTT